MRELNWNLFRAKFNGKEREYFENLSYQLFCAEHNNQVGIFRFKNQTGIESEPIKVNEELIGFQAKFYDTKISENKDEIIESIVKAKRENPELSKILFYLNQEFSESSVKGKKHPKYKIEIEEEAKKNKITIEWRVPSHFERQLALPQNDYLAEFFFDNINSNIVALLDSLESHTDSLLFQIHSNIIFNNQEIKIDRSQIVDSINDKLDIPRNIILSGEGGSGKTAIIKDIYRKHKTKLPFYVFKAVEFNVQDINSIFKRYGDYSLKDFIDIHSSEPQKVIVFDSAERISDLEYQEAFKEFLSELLQSSWTIIFTTRLSYLDDLRFQFYSIYRLPFEEISIGNLNIEELIDFSQKYDFELPINDKMKYIIQNPFYLDEYLRIYSTHGNTIAHKQYKEIIWARKIQNSAKSNHSICVARENCFLHLVKSRSEQGVFYIKPSNCKENILNLLKQDEIIEYDKNSGSYFISHDIYEEWGLNVVIERAFNSSNDHASFFKKIGSSLVIRRSFRQWLSDKLFENIQDIKPFIVDSFISHEIESFWKDEILISILLSDYSQEFFDQFKNEIIENDFAVLKKIVFLLRIACKEVEDSTIHKLLLDNLKFVFTKPKGFGWESTINLIYDNKKDFPLSTLAYTLPLFSEWCSKNKKGDTTKKIGLLALEYYTVSQPDNEFRYKEGYQGKLIKLIIHSANEIKIELTELFENIIKNGSLNRRSLHFELCKTIVGSDLDNFPILIALPNYILKIADLLWLKEKKESHSYHYESSSGVEKYYLINKECDYFPASAFQTPIYSLLEFSLKNTIDFIIDFTNKTTQNYVNSGYDRSIEEIELIVPDGRIHKQYICSSFWSMYRGTGSPVTPYLLQSIHMALEKFLLKIADNQDSDIVSNWLIYLIEKSSSASITAVVVSIILAHPNKFFDVAKIVFSTSSLFLYDKIRGVRGEHSAKSLYTSWTGLNYEHKIFEDERIKTLDDKHRKQHLESLILNYQFFANPETSEDEFKKRKEEIWSIIDKYRSSCDENNTIKRMLLTRIDGRNMNPITKQLDDVLIIDFNPKIDEDLKKHSDEALKSASETTKHLDLFFWSENKFSRSKKYDDKKQYENNPQLVLKETKEIIEKMNNGKLGSLDLLDTYTPAYSCSILIKEYSSQLSDEELLFCRDIIIEYASRPFHKNYDYQISDGVEVALNTLPLLIKFFPHNKDEILTFLLLILFHPEEIGQYKRVSDYSVEAIIDHLWKVSTEDAKKILYCFVEYKPKFDSILNEVKNEFYEKYYNSYHYDRIEAIDRFGEQYNNDLKTIFTNSIQLEDLKLNQCSLHDLETILQLIPIDTNDKELTAIILKILPNLVNELFQHDNQFSYMSRLRAFKKYSRFILFREVRDLEKYTQALLDNFVVNEKVISFLYQVIIAQDTYQQYNQFWKFWALLYPKIVSSQHKNHYFSELIHNYLLALNSWKKTAKNWHSITEEQKVFYKNVVKDIGHLPSVLDSIAQFLNQVGSGFLNEGIFWISEMLEKNHNQKLEINTIYYIEILIRRYIYLNRTKVKQDIKVKQKIIVVLNFLIAHSSVNAYLLREDIL